MTANLQTVARPRVLCVDDEPYVLAALSNTLRRRFDITTAGNGDAGLKTLAERGPFAIVISDFAMPGMNGAEFLAHARAAAPSTVRVLLTGHANMEAVVAAVNDGRIFKVLSKPCPPATLISTLEECLEHATLLAVQQQEIASRTVEP
jgi:DNA-binding NtrC family response regulator